MSHLAEDDEKAVVMRKWLSDMNSAQFGGLLDLVYEELIKRGMDPIKVDTSGVNMRQIETILGDDRHKN